MWANHPKFRLAFKELVRELRGNNGENLTNPRLRRSLLFGKEPPPKILFICGGDPKVCDNRLQIERYIKKHSENLVTFRAEYAWETMVELKSEINALALENTLAELSDIVLILVESFGTAAELGAFSVGEPLREKLLPILNKDFELDESFINTGPVRWVNHDSRYGPCIFTDYSAILTCMPDVLTRVDTKRPKIYASRKEDDTYGDMEFSRKELLFVVIQIINCIGPVTEKVINDVCKVALKITRSPQLESIRFITSLAVALEVVDKITINDEVYYFCKNLDNLKNNKAMKGLLDRSQRIRSRCLSHLVYIDKYNEILREVI